MTRPCSLPPASTVGWKYHASSLLSSLCVVLHHTHSLPGRCHTLNRDTSPASHHTASPCPAPFDTTLNQFLLPPSFPLLLVFPFPSHFPPFLPFFFLSFFLPSCCPFKPKHKIKKMLPGHVGSLQVTGSNHVRSVVSFLRTQGQTKELLFTYFNYIIIFIVLVHIYAFSIY